MREDWGIAKLEDMLDYVQPTKYIVSSTNYDDSYKTPVLTAGKSFIKGYTDEDTGIFDNIPVIIFDDFTTATQFVNFKFKVKSSAMKILVPTHEQINLKYVYYFMLTLRENTDTHKRYWISIFSQLPIPLAPLPEQRAIVAKLDQLFSEQDNGIENLRQARAKLEIYRQAVLKKAFEGELTREWREQQSNLPTADELLEQINAERKRHYEQQLADWETAVKLWEENGKEGRKPGRPKNIQINNTIERSDSEKLFKIPESHVWIKLGDLTLHTEYGTSAKSQKDGDIPVLRMGNIQNGRFDWSDLVYSTNKDEIDKYLLTYNDVLFNRTNSPELVGKTAVYKNKRPAIYAGYLIRINQIPSLCSADYLNYYLNSHPAKVYGNSVKTDGVNQSNINGQKLQNYPLPYSSAQEQTQIVQEIESRLSVCDKLTENIDASLKQAEAQRQSILKKAFEGRLLTVSELAVCRKEPDWCPAGELLHINNRNGEMKK